MTSLITTSLVKWEMLGIFYDFSNFRLIKVQFLWIKTCLWSRDLWKSICLAIHRSNQSKTDKMLAVHIFQRILWLKSVMKLIEQFFLPFIVKSCTKIHVKNYQIEFNLQQWLSCVSALNNIPISDKYFRKKKFSYQLISKANIIKSTQFCTRKNLLFKPN